MTLCSDWIVEADITCYEIPEGTDQDVIDNSITAASEILYGLTGRQWPGTCTETVRPCSNQAPVAGWDPAFWSYPWVPMRVGGQWLNLGPCGCNMRYCGCDPYSSVNLGRSDVQTITEVKVDGTVQSSSSYRLDSHQYLTRLAGYAAWPCCQDLTKSDAANGTWSVTMTYGFPIPQYLKDAAAKFAAELIKYCIGVPCQLPSQTTSVTRQGVTMELFDPQSFLEAGRTGIYEVDLAVMVANPNGLKRRSMVWSPETTGRGIRT